MKKQKGFSLIELIVVMTIIVLISSVAIISFSSTNKKARDARRTSDLQKIAVALEMARQIGSTYPTQANLVPTYLQAWPTDPKSTYSYLYVPGGPPAYTYTLYAQMEDPATKNLFPPAGNCGGVNTCNYLITNP